MRNLLVFAIVLLIGGVYLARSADNFVAAHPQAAAAPSAQPRDPVSSGRSLMVERERDGHFHIESRINGRFVPVLVDAGASRVILRETDAANAGIRPAPVRPYRRGVHRERQGQRRARDARPVEAGGIAVYDVPALALPDDVLSTNPARHVLPLASEALRSR
jgi:aspartyl protease family protein